MKKGSKKHTPQQIVAKLREAAGSRAAILMSFVVSCKNNSVEPWAYLEDVLRRLVVRESPLETWLPDRWIEQHPQHRWNIADERKARRK